jgi:hypothetical protein
MTNNMNFFDDLERQLVDATTDRRRRLWRARTRRAATLSTIVVAILAAGGLAAAAITTSDNATSSGGPAATATPTQDHGLTVPPTGAATPAPDAFTTAVLNATTVPGLARGVANRLANAKFKIGTVTNAATQDVSTTQVYYADVACIPAATEVAAAIGLRDFALLKATRGLRALAGNSAWVIVMVGSDQDTSPQP